MSILSLLAAFAASEAAVVTLPETSRYQDCVALTQSDIEAGRKAAQQWVSEGGGSDARHCLALADLEAGFPKLAAARLEEIAQRKDGGDDFVRARVLAQAAEAWLRAEEVDQAERAISEALSLVPDAAELQLTAAQVFAARAQWQKVINAVDAAEEAGIVSADTFVLRGRAYYSFGNYETAANDVVSALSIAPTNIEALLLRGDIQQTGIVIDVFYENPEQAE